MLVHRRAAALFVAFAAVGHISSGGSGSCVVGVLASTAPGGAAGNGQYRPPPPPPPPSSDGSGATAAAASANRKKGEHDDDVGAGGNAVKMPPPPPPPPRSRQQQQLDDNEMTTSTRTSAQQQYQRMPPPPPPLRQQQQGRMNSNQSSLGSRPANAGTGTAAGGATTGGATAGGATAGGATFSANLNAAVTMSNVGQEEREEMFQGQLQREAQGGASSAASDDDGPKNESSGAQSEASNTERFGSSADGNSNDSSQEHVQGHQEQHNSQGYGGHDSGEQQYDAQQQHQQEQTGSGWAQQPSQSRQQQQEDWQQHQSRSQEYEGYYYNQHQQQQQQQDQYYAQQQQQQREDGAQQSSSPATTDNDPASGRMVPYQRQYAQQQHQQHYMQQQAHGRLRQPPPGMQHQRPPPPGYHPQQNQGPNMFNGFMRRLEKGMDAVASLEDMVDKRARALGRTVKYATAGKMSVKEAVAASVAGSREGLRKIQRAERRARAAPNMFDLFKDDIEAAEAQVEQAEKQAAAADGNIGGTMRGGDAVGGAAPWDGPQIGGPNDMAKTILSNGDAPTSPSPLSVQSGGHGDAGSASLEQSSNPIEQLLGPPSSPSGPISAASSVPNGHDRIPSRPSRVVKDDDDDDDDDDWSDDSSKGGPLSKVFSFVPNPVSFIPSFRRKDSLLDLDDWSDEDDDWDTAASKRMSTPPASVRRNTRGMTQAQAADSDVPLSVAQLLGRGDSRTGESGFNLLSKKEGYQCHRLGRTRSLFDVAALVFFVVAINELSPFISAAIKDASTTVFQGRDGDIPIVGDIQGGKKLLSALYTAFSSSCKDSWAPLALASGILSIWSNDVFVRPAVRRAASAVSNSVRDQASSSQMFLRLVAGLPPRKAMPDVLAQSARRQVWSDVEASRLRSFIAMSTIALIALTVSIAKPIAGTIVGAGVDIASLEGWKWPFEWAVLGPGMTSHLSSMAVTIGALLGEEWAKVVENPLAVVVQASLFVV